MTLEFLHQSHRKPPRVQELEKIHADDEVALATEAERAEIVADQRRSRPSENRTYDRSPDRRIPLIPKVDETGKENLLDSFDALARYLQKRFDALAAGVEQMRDQLRAAEERSERLRHGLLDNGALRG